MKLRQYWKQIILGTLTISVATFLLYWCMRQIDFQVFWRDLADASFISLITAMGCIYAILLLNTWQWQLFLPAEKRLSFARMFRVIRVMAMMANVLPWGSAFSIYHLGQVEKVGKTVALSVMTLDQIIEGFAKLSIFLLVSIVAPIPTWMKSGIQIAVVTVVGAYLMALFFAHRHRFFEEQAPEDLASKRHKLLHFFSKWAHHLHVIRDVRKTIGATLLAILMKVCEAGAVYFVQLAFGVELPFWSSIFVVAAYNLSTMVPVVPANIGIFEATTFFVYKYMGVPPTQAMSLAIFNHLIYLIPMVVPGYWVSVRMGIKLSRSSWNSQKLSSLKTPPHAA